MLVRGYMRREEPFQVIRMMPIGVTFVILSYMEKKTDKFTNSGSSSSIVINANTNEATNTGGDQCSVYGELRVDCSVGYQSIWKVSVITFDEAAEIRVGLVAYQGATVCNDAVYTTGTECNQLVYIDGSGDFPEAVNGDTITISLKPTSKQITFSKASEDTTSFHDGQTIDDIRYSAGVKYGVVVILNGFDSAIIESFQRITNKK